MTPSANRRLEPLVSLSLAILVSLAR